ncbi:MAG: 4-(cytidine 5'-diphospho)-2-C-methyl-D-erythritol kinase [Rhizobiaceae bacterium]
MASPPATVAEPAPAKINLALHVTGRRPDGLHLLETLVVFARFGDRLEASLSDADGLRVAGRYAPDVPDDDTNLVLKARDGLRNAFPGRDLPSVAITLEKNLPVSSGVGGGSSDAAASLRALDAIWQLNVSERALGELAVSLGADVPMCLAARPLIARGIGESLEPLGRFPVLPLVLVNPGIAVSTATVFAALESHDGAPLPPLPSRFDVHTLGTWLEMSRNDLEPAARAIAPAIDGALSALRHAGARLARMSGSGATCFGLFETGNVAKRAAIAIRTRHPDWFVAATRSMASEGKAREPD